MLSPAQRPLRVLAADDSAVMRRVLKTIFDLHGQGDDPALPPMQLCFVARDGVECVDAVARWRPDILILDLEMPRMNGLDVLRALAVSHPELPVVMCSAHTEAGARATLEALACGARDYVMKPGSQRDFAGALDLLMEQLLPRIAALAARPPIPIPTQPDRTQPDRTQTNRPAPPRSILPARTAPPASRVDIVVIGISTGGPAALERMLPLLPADLPVPVLIVQHMPRLFTGALADRLDRLCTLRVREGIDGSLVDPGTVWIAPGDIHMQLLADPYPSRASRARPILRLYQDQPINHCRPSVDPLFQSAAHLFQASTLALIMTGMGSDGLEGCRIVHSLGGQILAQDEATSAIWGMPAQVVRAGLASAVLPLEALATEITRRTRLGRSTSDPRSAPAPSSFSLAKESVYGL